VAIFLLAVALAFASWRAGPRAPGPRPDSVGASSWDEDCASCHGPPDTVLGALAPERDWRPLADLLLAGKARFGPQGQERFVTRHPIFADASDERLAALIGHLASLPRDGASTRPAPAVTPADVRAARPR
jgi:hypothetical protein